ncbi:MAG: transporter substrate-binding domain-containing protein [Parafilimonas terrae]|nr:transporter substrate-binding domain-containing protein [Parafilimonas terrae]
MKAMRIGILAAALALSLAGVQARAETVKVGYSAEPYPPFTSPDAAGKWSGWEVDFTDAVCKEAKLDCVIVPVAWDGIIPALTSNKIDMIIASMSINDERQKTIDFTNKYYNTPVSIIAAKGSGLKPTADSLKGKTIGVQVSTIHEAYARKYFKGAEIKSYQTQDEANQDLAAGRIDATQADSVAEQAFLDTDQGKSCCENVGNVTWDSEILGHGVGIGLRKGETALKDKLNAAIAKIRSDGTYEKMTKKYFPFDIYGGNS